jgi:hypothetical protein
MAKETYVIVSKHGHGYAADHKKTKTSASYTKSLSKAMRFPSKSTAEADSAIDETVMSYTDAKAKKGDE